MTPALREYLAIRGRADELEGDELDALRTRLALLRFLLSDEERAELDAEPDEACWLQAAPAPEHVDSPDTDDDRELF